MAVSYITDSSGNRTSVVIDIESWNTFLLFNSEAASQLWGNSFINNPKPTVNIFTGEPINLLGTENFSVDGTEN